MSFIVNWWQQQIREPWQRLKQEHQQALTEKNPRDDWKVPVVLITCAISLTLLQYVGMTSESDRLCTWLRAFGFSEAADQLFDWLYTSKQSQLNRLTVWALTCYTVYVLIPILVIKFIFRERVRDYGTKIRGALNDWVIYAIMFTIMIPALIIVSNYSAFQQTYPFYDFPIGEPLWPNFWRWEIMYFCQFVSLEFFFRGFILHGLKRRLGIHAIYVMVVPYCMIHFHKPMLETFGAIMAGIALGFMSLKTRSIWLGAAIHITVAISMDLLSLWRQGYFS